MTRPPHERCEPGSNSGEPCRPSCESCGADTCAESNLTRRLPKTPLVATTRQNPAPTRTQPLDLIHPPRQIDSPIRPQNAQVGLATYYSTFSNSDGGCRPIVAPTVLGTYRSYARAPARHERDRRYRLYGGGGEVRLARPPGRGARARPRAPP